MSAPADPRLLALARSPLAPALVVVDVQRSFGDPAFLDRRAMDASDLEAVASAVATTASLVDAARARGVPVVWVELGSDPARPWRASDWLRGRDPEAPLGEGHPCVIGTPGAEWYGMSPEPGEIRVRKRGYSGFLGTGLDGLLREAGIGWLAVAGLTTECCVDATATDAFQLDYPVAVLSDATAAYQRRLHEAALEQLALNSAVIAEADTLRGVWEERAAAATAAGPAA